MSVNAVVGIVHKSKRVVYYWLSTYLKSHQPESLYDAPRKGRPRQMPPAGVLLFEDETFLTLFPVLRRAVSLQGQQGLVAVTGRNAQRVLFGTIDVYSGKRLVMQQPRMSQYGFQAFLQMLRRRYCSKTNLVVAGQRRFTHSLSKSDNGRST